MKERELKKAKRLAMLFLVTAAVLFVLSASFPHAAWSGWLKAISEAAMVGALADWFAVSALFKNIPIPFLSAHTAIIPRNKDKIADNLATFVEEKFLDPESIVDLIKQHDPVHRISKWLADTTNADRLGRHMAKAIAGVLDFTDDKKIQIFIKDAMHAAIAKVDLSKSMGAILDTLTKDGRHQQLLDEGISQLLLVLDKESTRIFIAEQIIHWLKTEHPRMEMLLPSGWIGTNSAEMVAVAIDKLLKNIGSDPEHQLRKKFDEAVTKLIVRLKNDPILLERGEDFKRFLTAGESLSAYTSDLWGSVRAWLKQDLARDDSLIHLKIVGATSWVGNALLEDEELRQSLNNQMIAAAHSMAPDFAKFLTRHISDTVKNWDAKELSRQIELNIGKDLQFIRINGTIVGGAIGAILYFLSWLFSLFSV